MLLVDYIDVLSREFVDTSLTTNEMKHEDESSNN